MDTVTGELISKLLDAVASLAQSKWKIIRTAKVELDRLVEKLERIKQSVANAEWLPFFKQKEIKSWMIELKGVLYDADDMLEAYQYNMELLKAKGESSTGRTLGRENVRMAFTDPLAVFKKHLLYPYKLGQDIKDIDQQLSRLIHDMESEDKLKSLLCGPNQDRNATSALDEKGMVGREGDKHELIKQLRGDVNSIVAIIGKGGLGKTFLAQMIFNDRRVKEHFADGVWWVCVSEKPNPIDLVKKLLEAIFKRDASDGAKDLETLLSKLQDATKDKRFLLVLDDVWDLDWWENLRLHLQGGAPGSKFLITSRKKEHMKRLEHHCAVSVHDLRGFTGEESRKLFIKQIGKTEAVLWNEGKLEIGERILKKCGDLPLVIKTVGSLLRTKETAAQWEKVEKSAIWSRKEEDDGEGVLPPGLVLSYDDLQAHLKNCFVYCSVFPKDFKMEKDMLAQQWIAHGFVKEKEGIDSQQSAEDCLKELVDRCLLEEGHADLDDRFLRMHDVIHDLALYIGDEEYSHDSVTKNTRHLSLIDKDHDSLSPDGLKFGSSKLRTLICHQGLPPKVDGDLKGLRVLQMWGSARAEFSQWIGMVLHLRYLELSSSDVESMHMLQDLPFLKTLRLIECQYIKWLSCLPKVEVMELKDLHSLEGWSSTEDGKAVILPCLRDLKIDGCSNMKWLPCLPKVEVMELNELESLKGWSSTEDGKAVILPCLRTLEISHCSNMKWLPSLPKVEVMELNELESLKGWSSTEDGKAVILPCLRTLQISDCSNIKWLPSLPKLEVMRLEGLHNLEGWSSTEDDKAVILPCLKELKIYWCTNIKWLPSLPKVEVMQLKGLHDLEGWSSKGDGKAVILPHLRELNIYWCSNIKWLPCLPKVEVMKLEAVRSLKGWSSTEDGKAVILSCLRLLLIFNCSNIEALQHFSTVVRGVLDMRFYIHDYIQATTLNSECSLECLNGYAEGTESFVLELFSRSVSKSPDHACTEIGKTHEHVFQSLQSPHNLETLSLRNYLGKQLPSWFSMDANIGGRLKELHLDRCLMLKVLTIHLPVVERMSLEGLWSFEEWSAGDDERAATFPRLKSFKMDDCPNIKLLPFLPVVEELRLTRLPKCKGWPKPVEMPYLRQPYVRDCPHLSCSLSSFNVVSQMRLDGDSNDCWSMIGVGNESPSFPSSSVELWFQNAREEFKSRLKTLRHLH
ncbi:unnamed protein product [Victoria cruziana]